MAATETSILILGAVITFEPVNGYQLRRELTSWRVDEWGHVNPGSIYSMLSTLARHGHVERHDLPEGQRTVAVYTSTPRGRAEFTRLFREAVLGIDVLSPLPAHTALNFSYLVPREEYLGCLRRRLEELTRTGDALAAQVEALEATRSAPDHVAPLVELQRRTVLCERDWLEEFCGRVEAGEFAFAGEPWTWRPRADDPGWQMHRDRQRYARQLGLPAD